MVVKRGKINITEDESTTSLSEVPGFEAGG